MELRCSTTVERGVVGHRPRERGVRPARTIRGTRGMLQTVDVTRHARVLASTGNDVNGRHGAARLIAGRRKLSLEHSKPVRRRHVAATRAAATAIPTTDSISAEPSATKLESLEPYFYYMGKKWGMKAYGIEFKECLRSEKERGKGGESDKESDKETLNPDVLVREEGDLVKGVGVYAAQDIDSTGGPKIIMEIPLPLMVTVTRDPPWMFYPNIVPLGHPIFDVINSTDPEKDWDLRLACLLLVAMDQSGANRRHVDQQISQEHFGLQLGPHFYTEFCDFLPPVDGCPSMLLATEDELAELQDARLAEEIRSEQTRVRGFWKQHWGEDSNAHPILARLAKTEEQFAWAVAQAQQRGVLHHTPMGTVDLDAHMLIPYQDMLNHSFSPNCFMFWRKIDRVMEIRTIPGQIIPKGEEMTLDYSQGGASNRELMLKFGFSMGKNPWERLKFSGEHKIHRETFLSAYDIVGYGGEYGYTDPVDENDVDEYQDESTIAIAKSIPTWSEGALPSLPSLEISAAKGLQSECVRILEKFETNLEEDLEVLREGTSRQSPAWILAIKYRIDQKMFLLRTIDVLEMYMERLLV